MIEYLEQKDREEVETLYPEGSPEREVIEYSRSTSHKDEVHPMLRTAFWLLMGISSLMAISALIGFSQTAG